MNIPVLVTVSNKYLWCLKPFAHLFNQYWSSLQKVIVAGYQKPDFDLPTNFEFISIREDEYDKDHWVDGLVDAMSYIRSNLFVLMLEDYWLCRTVDCAGIGTLSDYMSLHGNIIRMDLTADRLYAGGMVDYDVFGHYDLIIARRSPYQMSLQAAIWNKTLLQKFIFEALPASEHSAWQFEIAGSDIFTRHEDTSGVIVLGTRQMPMRYVNAMNSGTGFNKELTGINALGMLESDKNEVYRMIPTQIKGA